MSFTFKKYINSLVTQCLILIISFLLFSVFIIVLFNNILFKYVTLSIVILFLFTIGVRLLRRLNSIKLFCKNNKKKN